MPSVIAVTATSVLTSPSVKRTLLTQSLCLTGPACKISELKNAHIHTCRQYISWSCNNSTFGTVNFDSSPFTCSCKGGGGLNNFKFGIFVGCFPSEDAASMLLC